MIDFNEASEGLYELRSLARSQRLSAPWTWMLRRAGAAIQSTHATSSRGMSHGLESRSEILPETSGWAASRRLQSRSRTAG
jgi:hypothetical protein